MDTDAWIGARPGGHERRIDTPPGRIPRFTGQNPRVRVLERRARAGGSGEGLDALFPRTSLGEFSQRTRDELGATRRVLAEETPAHTPSSAQLAPSTPPVRAEFGPSPRGTRGLPPELAASSNGVCRELALSSRRARGELIHVQISTQPWIRLVNHSKIDHRAPLPRDTGMPR